MSENPWIWRLDITLHRVCQTTLGAVFRQLGLPGREIVLSSLSMSDPDEVVAGHAVMIVTLRLQCTGRQRSKVLFSIRMVSS